MSADLSDTVLDEATSRGETLIVNDLVRLIERYDTGPAVPRERLEAYVDALGENRFDVDAIREGLEERLSDAEGWQSEETVYAIDGHVSSFPPEWHRRLAGETDLTKYVATITADTSESSAGIDHGGFGEGVPERMLHDAAVVFGGYDYESAKGKVDHLRKEGLLAADADMHPNARFQLTEAGAEHLDLDADTSAEVDDAPGSEPENDPRFDE